MEINKSWYVTEEESPVNVFKYKHQFLFTNDWNMQSPQKSVKANFLFYNEKAEA